MTGGNERLGRGGGRSEISVGGFRMRLALSMARTAIDSGAIDPQQMSELCSGPEGHERGLAAMTAAAGVLLNAAALERTVRTGYDVDTFEADKARSIDEIIGELTSFIEEGEVEHLQQLYESD